MTNDTSQILSLARIYAIAKGYTLNTVSLRIAGQGSLFGRLSKGEADLTLRRRDSIFQEFSANWPPDLEWPESIPRPEPVATNSGSQPKEAA